MTPKTSSSPLTCSAVIWFAVCFALALPANPSLSICKYSVRDVAFVNVHGKHWQLQLVKPDAVKDEKFAAWNRVLKDKLQDANLGFIWHSENSDVGKRLTDQFLTDHQKAPRDQPVCAIGRAGVAPIFLPLNSSRSFAENVEAIVSSPARTKILNHVVDSLCVFVLVESGEPVSDREALQKVKDSVAQVNKQMWTLEKPADRGPQLVVVDPRDEQEELFLQSIGIEGKNNSPTVAIIYGQGRRLGGLIHGEELTIKKLVGRASICGQDCECELNRDWLYGSQIIHNWPKKNERLAEASLNFDPHSAFVIAEVAQILQKTNGKPVDEEAVDLGGGLIIHDFDVPQQKETADASHEKPEQKQASAAPVTTLSQPQDPVIDTEPVNQFPWILITSLFVITIVVWAVKLKTSRH